MDIPPQDFKPFDYKKYKKKENERRADRIRKPIVKKARALIIWPLFIIFVGIGAATGFHFYLAPDGFFEKLVSLLLIMSMVLASGYLSLVVRGYLKR